MGKQIDKFADQDQWKDWIGKEVVKHSNKPFKSGNKIGVVADIVTNPNSKKIAFKMLEDESIVDCFQCKLA